MLFRFQYNLNEEIRREFKRFFNVISKVDFDFSEKLKTRDFVHLYEFQKYFLHKSIRRLTELVKVKQHHYFMQKRNIEAWKKLGKFERKTFLCGHMTFENVVFSTDLKLDEMSFEAADLVMNYPNRPEQFCECVRKLSKFICVEINAKLEKQNVDDIDIDTGSEFQRSSLLSESE